MPVLPMSSLLSVSVGSSVLLALSQRTAMRIWREIKNLVMEPAQHELVEWLLTMVRRYLVFENGVETMKEVDLPKLQKV